MKTVFLIDDDSDDREIFEEALSSIGIDIDFQEAENGEVAFKKLKDPLFKRPDIIFLDLNMPKMDGRQFLQEIKNINAFKDIPVIIYSTSSNAGDIKFTLEHKATKFMTKQNSIYSLRSELESTLKSML